MTSRRTHRALPAVLLALAASAAVPALASASTYTVDDDLAQCPSASFRSIQAAVNQAAPHDTVVVCAGLYQESSTPPSSTSSPAQAGSRNGLTIDKPLTIRGAGASKVTIQPDPALGTSLAGTAPFLRDGGGNVISITRQSLGATDADENRVDISGVTVTSPSAYAEAGVAYFNTSGSITASVIGPLRRGDADSPTPRPHGYGVVMTNSLIGGSVGSPRREVTIADSLVTGYGAGGVLFDGASGTDGSAASTSRAGINMYGYVDGSRIVGGGSNTGFLQNGIRYAGGTRGQVIGSEIVDNAATQTVAGPPAVTTRSSGLLLSDAEVGADPQDPSAPGFSVTQTTLARNAYGLSNVTSDGVTPRTDLPALATGNFWGCTAGPLVGAPSSSTTGCQGTQGAATTTGFLTRNPTAIAVPAPTPDAAPTAVFANPADGVEVAAGDPLDPVVAARDDFGVSSVALRADGVPVATATRAPYEFSYTPSAAQAGTTVTLEATVTDSSGQAMVVSARVPVRATPTPPPTDTTPTDTTPADTTPTDTTPTDTTGTTPTTPVTPGDPGAPGSPGTPGTPGAPGATTTTPGTTTTIVTQVPVPVPGTTTTTATGTTAVAGTPARPAIRSTSLRATADGRRVAVRLSGSATTGTSFRGEVRLTRAGATLARQRFAVPAGTSRTVRLTLTRTAYRRLVRARSLRVSVTVTSTGSDGVLRRSTRTLTLRAPARR